MRLKALIEGSLIVILISSLFHILYKRKGKTMLEQQILEKIKFKADAISADLGATVTRVGGTEPIVQSLNNKYKRLNNE